MIVRLLFYQEHGLAVGRSLCQPYLNEWAVLLHQSEQFSWHQIRSALWFAWNRLMAFLHPPTYLMEDLRDVLAGFLGDIGVAAHGAITQRLIAKVCGWWVNNVSITGGR
jgi:hypothetical protein